LKLFRPKRLARISLRAHVQTADNLGRKFFFSRGNVSLLITYDGGPKSFRPDQIFKVTEIKQLCYFSIYIYIYKFAVFQYSLTIDGAIYPSQHFPYGAAFVCQAGNFWTHPRIFYYSTDILASLICWLSGAAAWFVRPLIRYPLSKIFRAPSPSRYELFGEREKILAPLSNRIPGRPFLSPVNISCYGCIVVSLGESKLGGKNICGWNMS
jgi:hypothetical protein